MSPLPKSILQWKFRSAQIIFQKIKFGIFLTWRTVLVISVIVPLWWYHLRITNLGNIMIFFDITGSERNRNLPFYLNISVVVWIFNLSWPYFWIFKFACNIRISLSSGRKKLLLSLTWLMIIIWLTFEILNRGSYRAIQDEGLGHQLSCKWTYSKSDMHDGDA